MEKVNFIEYSLFSQSLSKLPLQPTPLLVNTINQYSFCVAEHDVNFKKSLLGSDVLLPDGISVVLAVRFLTGRKIRKIPGAEIHQFLLEELNRKSGSCFYLGSSESTLQKIKDKMSSEFPNIRVGTYSPPYKPEFDEKDNKRMIEAVDIFQPDALFVGMTAPKQEKWAYEHKAVLNTKIICTIGAVFDFYAGTVERPRKVWITMGLEWLIRLINEPRRLWKRYLYYGPIFIWLMFKEKIKLVFD